jgi:AbrB family looped-hinge helix DNA binding protein
MVLMDVTIDKAGRVVIPKRVRDALGLQPGDALELQSAGEQITIRPVRQTMPLRREHGIWVYRSGKPLPPGVVEETLRALRRERELRFAATADKERE